MQPQFVDRADSLRDWADRFRRAPFLAVDTEFVREETYYPKLCLLQIGDGSSSVCFDTIALRDLTPLFALMRDAGIVKVFHAAAQDLEIFVRHTGFSPVPLFDTQIAASLLGWGEQLGYAGLVERLAGVKLDKTLARTDWTRRPLPPAALSYAADDVRLLADLYPRIEAELRERGRLQWLEEDCIRLADTERYLPAPALEWERLKGLARLDPAGQRIAAILAAWREVVAEQRDRPRKWILSDDAVYRIAERRPQSRAQLEDLQVLPPKSIERHADTLLGLVTKALQGDLTALVVDEKPDEATKARMKRLSERMKGLSTELGIGASMLAPRADLERLATQGADAQVQVLRGWRRAVVGEELLKVL